MGLNCELRKHQQNRDETRGYAEQDETEVCWKDKGLEDREDAR